MTKYWKLLLPVLIGFVLFKMQVPVGLEPRAWHLFSIFVGTIVGIILSPMPMGAIALMGLSVTVLTGTLDISKEALNGFAAPVIWLVVFVFFVARAFIKTHLGNRIAYYFVRALGKNTLGLGYGLAFTEMVIAPFIPSNAARCGGIMFPIIKSIAESLGSDPKTGTERKLGSYIIQTSFNANFICSSMFLTAMAANPMAQAFAAKQGVNITWVLWFKAAIIPGIISMLLIPLILYFIYPPEQKHLPEARNLATRKLEEMGPLGFQEWIMIAVFAMMLGLWIVGEHYGIPAVTAGMLGICVLLLTKVLTWDDILNEREAWHTLVWLSILVGISGFLDKLGFVTWFSKNMEQMVCGYEWHYGFIVLSLIYFYAHYFFASQTAHISAMYAGFLAVSLSIGTPPILAALVLSYFSTLSTSLTHYSSGSSAVLYGAGYVKIGHWWGIGLFVSLINLLIWGGIGSQWWKYIGVW